VAAVDPASGAGSAVAVSDDGVASAITDTAGGVDLPLEWSPDGNTLAVRSVEGVSGADGGESRLEFVSEDGERESVSSNADVLIVGWLE
jgi:hypothetical protein